MKRGKADPSLQLVLDLICGENEVLHPEASLPSNPRRTTKAKAPLLDHESAAAFLSGSDDFRVLRRLKSHQFFSAQAPAHPLIGVYIDCETEGLDIQDKIIEIGLVRFVYEADSGVMLSVAEPQHGYSAFEDPGKPLTKVIRDLTGIRDEDVQGQAFDDQAIAALVSDASLIIAHNAGFDRPRLEKRFPFFADKPWACSFKDVDWAGQGISSAKLDYLAYKFGFFFDGHRAVTDCFAGLEVLSKPLPQSDKPVMQALLDASGKGAWRHFANPARYQNDRYREMGYRWCGKERSASWYKDYTDQAGAEAAWQKIAQQGIAEKQSIRKITALDRYSAREMSDE
ncbi:MAG: 3'-5' exonuclease [Sulfuricellaceae bacterium]|nr:3'-5' exonuclease [Sulfuricellaceae bacterium]